MTESFAQYGIDLPNHFSGDRKTRCPKCSHTRRKSNDPCLSVNGETGMWKCHNCGWSGKLSDSDPALAPSRKIYRRPAPEIVKPAIDPGVADYFSRRGISAETLAKVRVYSDYHYLPGTQVETLCMAFPYYRGGELLNVKYRDARKNMAQEKDPEPCLWNIDNCKGAETIYITEGEMDTLTLIECGFPTAVSVDKGAPQPNDADASKKLECVTNCIEALKNADWVVLVTDKDEPGLRLEKELLNLIGPEKCKLVTYPDDCKDINDVLVKHGSGSVVRVMLEATPAPVPGLRRVFEFGAELDEFYRKGQPRGLSTGYPDFDRYFSLQPGSLNIITGIPTSGKTEFVHQLVIKAIELHNWKAVVFSPEMLPVTNLIGNFAEKLIGKPMFGRAEERMTWQERKEAEAKLNEHLFIYQPPADETPDLQEILSTAQVCIARHSAKMLIIDPYNEMEHTRDRWMNETEYVSYFLGRLRKFARQTGAWIGLVAHPTKLKKEEKSKQYPVATLYDIAGSANFYNKADNGLSLWRDMKDGNDRVQVHILKVKGKHIGRGGTKQDFLWDRKTGRFSLPAPIDPEDGPPLGGNRGARD